MCNNVKNNMLLVWSFLRGKKKIDSLTSSSNAFRSSIKSSSNSLDFSKSTSARNFFNSLLLMISNETNVAIAPKAKSTIIQGAVLCNNLFLRLLPISTSSMDELALDTSLTTVPFLPNNPMKACFSSETLATVAITGEKNTTVKNYI